MFLLVYVMIHVAQIFMLATLFGFVSYLQIDHNFAPSLEVVGRIPDMRQFGLDYFGDVDDSH